MITLFERYDSVLTDLGSDLYNRVITKHRYINLYLTRCRGDDVYIFMIDQQMSVSAVSDCSIDIKTQAVVKLVNTSEQKQSLFNNEIFNEDKQSALQTQILLS